MAREYELLHSSGVGRFSLRLKARLLRFLDRALLICHPARFARSPTQ